MAEPKQGLLQSKGPRLFSLAFGYTVSLIYGICFVYRLAWRWLKDRSVQFWKVKPRVFPPDCLNDPNLGNHAYIQIKNVKLHYVEKGDRSKPLMLCLHGFPEFWYSWRHQIKEFSSDYWVVAVDMRGYGDSEKPAGRGSYRLDILTADVKNLVIALGKEKCTLVAHDWGGIVAWCFVLTEPQLIDSYIIMNSAHPIAFGKVMKKKSSQFKKSWYVFFFQLPYLPELMLQLDDMEFIEKAFRQNAASPITETDLEAFKFTFGKPGALTYPVHYYRANFMLRESLKLNELGKEKDFPPGLILYGEKDSYLDNEIQEESAKQVVNASVVCIKDTNHFVQQDNPAAVNEAMRTFLNQLKPKE